MFKFLCVQRTGAMEMGCPCAPAIDRDLHQHVQHPRHRPQCGDHAVESIAMTQGGYSKQRTFRGLQRASDFIAGTLVRGACLHAFFLGKNVIMVVKPHSPLSIRERQRKVFMSSCLFLEHICLPPQTATPAFKQFRSFANGQSARVSCTASA